MNVHGLVSLVDHGPCAKGIISAVRYYTSIDPKQLQNDSLGPILYIPKRVLGTSDLLPQELSIDIANCSATREDKRRAGQEDKTRSQSSATEFRAAGSQCVQGWSVWPEDKRRATAGQEKDSTRTRPSHRAWPQSPAKEFRGAASQCGQLLLSKIEPQQ